MDKKIFSLLITLGVIYFVMGDCPDITMNCPTGESFTFGTCWSWRSWNCQTCRSIMTEVRSECREYSCGGSTSNWYGRNDGCSAGIVSGPMTEVFRAACGIHDICYATPGRPKERCDVEFLTNMLKTCTFPGLGSIAYRLCVATANIAYLVVRDHGNNFPDFASTCHEV